MHACMGAAAPAIMALFRGRGVSLVSAMDMSQSAVEQHVFGQ